MHKIPAKHLKRLRQIFHDRYHVKLTREQTLEAAESLLSLVTLMVEIRMHKLDEESKNMARRRKRMDESSVD